MGRPSMFSRDYHKIMRRRKIIFRLAIVIISLAVIVLAYNKSAVMNLEKMISDLRGPSNIAGQTESSKPQDSTDHSQDKSKDNTAPQQNTPAAQGSQESKAPQVASGEYTFTFPNNEALNITYESNNGDIRIKGIRTDNKGISYSIRYDGKAVVFDNPEISGIWIYSTDNTSKRLDPDTYKQVGGEGLVFYKEDVMSEYENYVWAARPEFLKDGRIIYQSNMPWFKENNNVYLWITDAGGENNRWFLNTDQMSLVNYAGFLEDNRPIIEIDGGKYALNIEDGSRTRVD